jgi:hypothetical protein
MTQLSMCLAACYSEECLIGCLVETLNERNNNKQLNPIELEIYTGLLLENIRARSYDGVTLFTEMWNTYDRNILVMATYIIPEYMKYLTSEQEMVLYAAINTVTDSYLVVPFARKITESYQPEFDQWALFLEKLSGSDNTYLRYIHSMVLNLLISTGKIIPEVHSLSTRDHEQKDGTLKKDFVTRFIKKIKKSTLFFL